MAEPKIAQKAPYKIDVEEGKKYFWCSCGQSAKQPFCDGSHSMTEFKPIPFSSDSAKTVFFCGCKKSGSNPLCDGTHKNF
ncbi:CDGSH iron-sulfur domain-containing protein [Sneathiella marina]|uniref:CDGSH iron-sulfur domain-containing protein n=1 Tax=Sneathiella marina TaxID=2950108 RepID=UPI003B84AD66